jgi:GNAT superfamily N-acetyltransferase
MSVKTIQATQQFNQWDKLLELLHAAFAYQTDRIDPPSSLYQLDAHSLSQKAKEEYLFLAMESGELIGCAFAKVKLHSVYVGKIAVLPERQGQGVGRLLMQAVEGLARTSGKPVMDLETRIELLENQKTFSAFGFIKTGEHSHPGYVRPTFISMQKNIASVGGRA